MKTRLPIQAKNTDYLLKSILPEDFKMVSDKTSNGYKFINLLYGVEVDQYRDRLQYIYDSSFLETMDLSDEGTLYEVYLSGIPKEQYLNSTLTNAIKIKIVNWGSQTGESEFWDGDPTRVILSNIYSISGIVESGNIVGINYFRENASGYGYFLINTNIDQSQYGTLSGSTWKINLDNVGTILSSTGTWPGIKTLSYEEQQVDDILFPLGSGYLRKTYPLTRRIKDDSGVYQDIDYYEPYLGWVRDVYGNVAAINNYSSDYKYDSGGNKIWHRTAFNNPYGSGNYTTEYLQLRNIPISGTLKLYDLDNLDTSGNATEISGVGTTVYRLQSSNMFIGNETGVFDPIYVGYTEKVPYDRGFGAIEGQTASSWITTSWDYQYGSGYIDPDTQTYIEGSGEISNMIKIVNPISRYLAVYKYKIFSQARAITSLEGNKYLNYDSLDPLYAMKTVFNNEEPLEFQFTRDPAYSSEKSKFITFDGWTTRPGTKISKIGFNLPITVAQGPLDSLITIEGRNSSIGYGGLVPDVTTSRNYTLDCPFAEEVYLGTVTESDLSGSGNFLEWFNTGANEIYRLPMETSYGKRIRYVGSSGYYKINSQTFIKDNTFFRFKFRAYTPQTLTLMELSEASTGNYIKVQADSTGLISIISNGVEQYYSFNKIVFDNTINDLLIRYYPDPNFTDNPVFNLYIGSKLGYIKPRVFVRETDNITASSTYLHVYKNCSIDISAFQIYYETDYGTTI